MYSEFENIINRLKQGRLWRFSGGVTPSGRKALSNQTAIDTLPLPKRLYVPVKQHIGVEGQVAVSVGEQVLKGQKLTRSTNPFSVPVHAPTSGKVVKIGPHVSAHPSGLAEMTIVIEPDELDTWGELSALPDYQKHPKFKVIETICAAGVSGMGGAGFPTHIKAAPKKDVEFLVINGVECEPYISSDDRLMREHAWQIRQGIDVLTHLLSPKQVLIAIEDNKPEAIEAMQVACQENSQYLVVTVPTRYPAGGEKQLIQMLTNREVPHQGLPIDVGVIMQNVGTCFAVADAIFSGKPLIQRVVTLTGEALNKRGNVWALLGTPMSHLLQFGEYQRKRQREEKIVMGGPMMGFDVASDEVPVVKITNCVLVPSYQEMPRAGQEQPCIRCGACADACPANLLPQQLYWHSKAKETDKAQDYNLFDCIECGACAFVCPSEIPLVHYYRVTKAEIRAQEEEKDKAEKARERFEARKARLLKEQQEREEKHRRAAEARRQKMAESGDEAKDKIAAALARAKAKKRQSAPAEEAISANTQDTKTDKVAAAVARAKAKRAAKAAAETQDDSASTDTSPAPHVTATATDNKADKVAAAVARAKAKRAAKAAAKTQDGSASADTSPAPDAPATDNEADKVAAAVARAKAKRAAKAAAETQDGSASADTSPAPDAPATDNQADKVAVAVARAKAKRAAKADTQNEPASADQSKVVRQDAPVQQSAASPAKNDKVAAAIAKAKARRAAQKQNPDKDN